MIVAGKLSTELQQQQPYSFPISDASDAGKLIEYEILATEATGQYRVDGKYEETTSKVWSMTTSMVYFFKVHH